MGCQNPEKQIVKNNIQTLKHTSIDTENVSSVLTSLVVAVVGGDFYGAGALEGS